MSAHILLASGSEIRAQLLRQAGVPFEVQVARVDEEAIKAALLAEAFALGVVFAAAFFGVAAFTAAFFATAGFARAEATILTSSLAFDATELTEAFFF